MKKFLFITICFLFTQIYANNVIALPIVKSVEVKISAGVEHIFFIFNKNTKYKKLFSLKKPSRIVLDVESIKSGNLFLPNNYKGIIKNIRFGTINNNTSRIVLDLSVIPLKFSLHKFPSRIGIEIIKEKVDFLSSSNSPIPKFKPLMLANKKNKPLIIIDAGHGGKDPGAIGYSGTIEKRITLLHAKQLQKTLLRSRRYRVFLTRERDNFIFLNDRVKLAREKGGDIFISLHADSAPKTSARGLSIYTLSENASDKESAALAERENKADIIENIDLSYEDSQVADILIELAQRETRKKSSNFAEIIAKNLKRNGIHLLQNAHRYAGFRVLKAPDIPSILIEVGFLSNYREEKIIASYNYRQKLSNAILSGLDNYFRGV